MKKSYLCEDMKFLTVVFCIVLFFYLLSLVGRAMLRVWVFKKTRQFQRQDTTSRRRTKREGDVTIQTGEYERSKRIRSDAGDYVDYEEIKDKA